MQWQNVTKPHCIGKNSQGSGYRVQLRKKPAAKATGFGYGIAMSSDMQAR